MLGGNLGEVKNNFVFALKEMQSFGNIKENSSLYRSEPWGMESENYFLNQIILIETTLKPIELLKALLKIESNFERKRSSISNEYYDRHLDLDILFYNNEVIKTDQLTIPHPKLHKRKFTLLPLAQIAKAYVHPVINASIQDLLIHCKDDTEVSIYG